MPNIFAKVQYLEHITALWNHSELEIYQNATGQKDNSPFGQLLFFKDKKYVLKKGKRAAPTWLLTGDIAGVYR